MQNRGRIIALDVDEEKLAELEKRARRASAGIIETRVIKSTKAIKRLTDSADRVLLDVPCSGTGVLRRNPDIKWRITPEDLARLLAEQQHLLSYYSRMVKPGGRLVYATCSVLPSEGEDQVRTFLQSFGDRFKLVDEKRLDPHTFGFDGFYMAALECTAPQQIQQNNPTTI
jgi:16S rRNA (cytosine967-C5)-methyltransferase